MKKLFNRQQGWFHKLFFCCTFWTIRPFYHCSQCGKGIRCYWDGNDTDNNTNLGELSFTDCLLCNKCVKEITQ